MTKLRALAEQTIKEANTQMRATEQQMARLAEQRKALQGVIAQWQEALDEPVVVPSVKRIKTHPAGVLKKKPK